MTTNITFNLNSMDIKNMDLTEFLLQIVRPRPGMFCFQNKLLYLYIFLSGYRFGNISSEKDRFWEYFNDWFIVKTKSRKGAMWYPEILDECGKSEEKALLRFFEYLEEFDKEVRKEG